MERNPELRVVRLACVAAMVAVSAGSQPLSAQAYPVKPIKLIVTSPPGGPGSLIARPIAQRLGEVLGQPVVIDFVTGAAGLIGTDMVAKAAPDGYTLVQVSTRLTLAPSMYKKLPYDTLKDLAPVTPVTTGHIVWVVHPSIPAKSAKELIALAKKQPGKLTFGSSGVGTSLHLAGEMVNSNAGVQMLHIPYRGAGPALVDVMGGQVDMMFVALPPALPLISARRLKPLGVASLSRVDSLPGVPTISESGLPDFLVDSRNGILTTGGTPRDVVAKLNSALVQILQSKDIGEKFRAMGVEPLTSTPAEFAQYIRTEIGTWAKIVKAAKIEPE